MAKVLITGTSSGIGFATAVECARSGHSVVATMRDLKKSAPLQELARKESLPIEVRALDVTSDESVRQCFQQDGDQVEVLVNNAGVEVHGTVEELPIEEFASVMNTNYLGAVRCMKAVIPTMRTARKGLIVSVSSVAGKISNSPLGPYSASKFALEAISESAAGELKAFNVRVSWSNPEFRIRKWLDRLQEHPHARLIRKRLDFPTYFGQRCKIQYPRRRQQP